MNIAIMAANGKLATAIIKSLVKEAPEHKFVALARTPSKASFLVEKYGRKSDLEVRPGDYEKEEELEKSLQGVDCLLLISGMDKPEKRILQHRHVIAAAKKAGVKKIIYTSIQGAEKGNGFSPIVQANRQTEEDIRESGLKWSIGRNGLYIEPDIDYIENYKRRGKVQNCAQEGKCSYTTREELAHAYTQMILHDKHDGKIYNLSGEPITQEELTKRLNKAFNTNLSYESIGVTTYKNEEVKELGEHLGEIIAGIYEAISQGAFNNKSDYEEASGRPHQSWDDYFNSLEGPL